jgi:hypothetical protein
MHPKLRIALVRVFCFDIQTVRHLGDRQGQQKALTGRTISEEFA